MNRRGFFTALGKLSISIAAAPVINALPVEKKSPNYGQFPIDSRTIAEAMNIPNFGNKPDLKPTRELWIEEQRMKIESNLSQMRYYKKIMVEQIRNTAPMA